MLVVLGVRVQHKYAYLNRPTHLCTYSMHEKQQKYASNENRHMVWGMGTEDVRVPWVWGFCGIPTGFSVGRGWVWGLKCYSHGSPIIKQPVLTQQT